MKKRTKIILLAIGVMVVIKIIHSLFCFVIIPNRQKAQVIKIFYENFDSFETIQKYFAESDLKLPVYIKKDEEGRVYIQRSDERVDIQIEIEDELAVAQIENILCTLDFEYIEVFWSEITYVFQEDSVNGHFQSIEYSEDDSLTRIKGWSVTELGGHWYYRSIWLYFLPPSGEENLLHMAEVIFRVVRGY